MWRLNEAERVCRVEWSKTVPYVLCVAVVTFTKHHCPVSWTKARLAEWNSLDKCSVMNKPLLPMAIGLFFGIGDFRYAPIAVRC